MCQYQSKNMEVEINIISPESFLNLTFLELFNFWHDKVFLRPHSQEYQN